ncbi:MULTISPECIES: hypothetical protein [Psychrobacter]|jgi:hypothetical protein|uniref:hypothetical protein n=1 Tax=Psychrobacter TaxID=497 RepID=UPI0004112F1A|nr:MULTISPECIES: hypothetical protein [Psychrobacter]
MFKYSLIFVMVILCSCSVDTSETKTSAPLNETLSKELSSTDLHSTGIGIKQISDKEFIHLLEKSCSAENLSYPEKCLYYDKVSNYSFDSINLDRFSDTKSKVILDTRLLLGSKNDDGDYTTKTLKLSTNIDGLEIDSINIYEYEFNEYSYNERIFYMNQDFELWILNSIMFEGVLYVVSWEKYNINPKTGKISIDSTVHYTSIHESESIYKGLIM